MTKSVEQHLSQERETELIVNHDSSTTVVEFLVSQERSFPVRRKALAGEFDVSISLLSHFIHSADLSFKHLYELVGRFSFLYFLSSSKSTISEDHIEFLESNVKLFLDLQQSSSI